MNGEFEHKLLSVLTIKRALTAPEIAMTLNVPIARVRFAIQTQRKRFLAGKTKVRITTGPKGYTLSQSKTNVLHETTLRMGQIAGNALNGTPVFMKCKAIAAADFNGIQIRYQPKMLQFNRIIKRKTR